MLSVLHSVLTQDCAKDWTTKCDHNQQPNYDADECSSPVAHRQFPHGLPTPPESVRALHLKDPTVVKWATFEDGRGNAERKECTTVPKEAQVWSNQDYFPISLSWEPPAAARAESSNFERPRKKTLRKTVSSGLKGPKSNQVVDHDGLLTAAMLQTIDRIGGIQVLEGLRDTIGELNVRAQKDRQSFNERCGQGIPKHLAGQPDSMRQLWLLKEELNLTEKNERIYRLRKRLTLAEFSYAYDSCALQYMENMSSPQRPRSRPGQRVSKTLMGREARNAQHKRAAMDHFVDLLFPGSLPSGKTKRATRKGGTVTRYAAARKIQNWRTTGLPWANIITRFGKGMLLLIPDEVSDE